MFPAIKPTTSHRFSTEGGEGPPPKNSGREGRVSEASIPVLTNISREKKERRRYNLSSPSPPPLRVEKEEVVEFVEELEKADLDIWWYAVIRGDMFTEDDHELLVRMKNIKCEALAYSIESASDKILKLMDKRMDMKQFAAQKRAQ